jgi:hypothetical protein
MEELQDYSGPYRPDIKLEDFSKEALVRLIWAYRRIFVGIQGMYLTVNRKRTDLEEAWDIASEAYEEVVKKFYNQQLKEAMNIQTDDVHALLKIFQLAPDGLGEGFYECDYDVKSENEAVLTFKRCPTLFHFESQDSQADIQHLCGPGGCEDRAFVAICKTLNPRLKSTALQLPPRKSKDDICCRWQFKIESEA